MSCHWFTLISVFAAFGSGDNWCDEVVADDDLQYGQIGDFMKMAIAGYFLDQDESGFGSYDQADIQSMIMDYTSHPEDSPDCVFKKYVSFAFPVCYKNTFTMVLAERDK